MAALIKSDDGKLNRIRQKLADRANQTIIAALRLK
jgi:hypothetical protein